jgi:hydroxyethylthiazole kinase-like uncharacterized protein yjeF
MKALTAAEMREVDSLTIARIGIPSDKLMETAGTLAAKSFLRIAEAAGLRSGVVCVLCGKGNNGGDGFVVARHLRDAGRLVKVFLFAGTDELRGDAATNCARWRDGGGEVVGVAEERDWAKAWPEVAGAEAIVDAIFGTGFRGGVSGAVGRAISDVNKLSQNATAARPGLIFAVDMPSGLPSDGGPAEGAFLWVHHTATFTAPKVGQLISRNSAAVGTLRVLGIGSPAAVVEEVGKGDVRWSEPEEFAKLGLVRTTDGNKGLYGHILVVAGSLGKSGAAVMSGSAALWSGAGLVTVATADVVLPTVAAAHPEYMTESLDSTPQGTAFQPKSKSGRFGEIEKGKTVLAMGPGMGQHPKTQEFIRLVVKQTKLPLILDADGLNAFAGRADQLGKRNTNFLVITPHPGEMARLMNSSVKEVEQDRVKTAVAAAKRWNAHVILKGAHTVIAAPDGRVFVNTTGNPGLAKGGSGDVLTGVLAAMTGQFKTDDWLRVLALGVYLHGAAAEVAAEGQDVSGVVASDVAKSVSKARRKLLRELQASE